MIPTFVITLREGVEASLIVGIIAAFLVKEGRRDAMRQMWIGVAIAIALCVGVAVALRLVGEQLPQQQQEGLETVVGLVAVSTITYMIVWMRRHARGIKAALEGEAASALAARLDDGAGRDGVPRGPARGLRDLGLPARRLPGRDRHDRRRRRRGARPARRDRDRRRPLPRRRADQPDPLLPGHRPGPRLRRRRPARDRRPHRARGGLDQRLPEPGARPDLAGPAGHDLRLAADRDARPAAAADGRSRRSSTCSTRCRWRSTCSGPTACGPRRRAPVRAPARRRPRTRRERDRPPR